MEIQEIYACVKNIFARLNFTGFGIVSEVNKTSSDVEVLFYFSQEEPSLVLGINTDSIRIIHADSVSDYKEIEETYGFTSYLTLFQQLIQLIFLEYNEVAPKDILSMVLSSPINNWQRLVAAICRGTGLSLSKSGSTLYLRGKDTHKIAVFPTLKQIKYRSYLDLDLDYESLTDLIVALLGLLDYVFENEGVEFSWFLQDESDKSVIDTDDSSVNISSDQIIFEGDGDLDEVPMPEEPSGGDVDDTSILEE